MTRKISTTITVFAALAAAIVLGRPDPAHAVSLNNLSFQGTMGRIRVRPVVQLSTGATVLQTGDPNSPPTNPNRTIGDTVVPLTHNTPGLRVAGVNSFAGDGHTHYHAGDRFVVVNDVTGFEIGDTILIGSPYCNHEFLGQTCKGFKPGLGLVNEQPFGQVGHIVSVSGTSGPGLVELAQGLTNSARCFTSLYGPCAFVEGQEIVKLPTLYQGQQFRVDIPHTDIVNGSPNDVVVTASFVPPQGTNDPAYPRRPLALNRENPTDFDVIIDNACGASGCGAGFVSFYIPKEITGNGTIGNTFSVDAGHTWYTVEVTARDVVTGTVRADGVARFKLNPVAITEWAPDRDQITATEAVNLYGKLRDNSSAVALSRRPVEDVIVDVTVRKPSGARSRYALTSCADTNPGAADTCGGDPFGGQPNNHGAFQLRLGGPQGLFVGFPNIFTSRLNCSAGSFNITNPATYGNVLGVPECVLAPFLAAIDTLETGTYEAVASLRGYQPAVTRATSFDVVLL